MASLSFELPPHLAGLEDLICERARDFIDPLVPVEQVAQDQPERFDSATRTVAIATDRQVRGYWALARIATKPGTLAYGMRSDPNIWDQPPLFDPDQQAS